MAKLNHTMAVYCGHSNGARPIYAEQAAILGKLMAETKIRLVYGGGKLGLMGAVAGAVKNNGGEVVGVTTQDIINLQEPALEGIKIEIADNISERKRKMFELSDAFCILPGGLGTVDELTEIMTMQQIRESNLPIYFLNTEGYWNIMGKFIAHMQREGFMGKITQYNIHILNTPEEIIRAYKSRFFMD
jgi:uncharacterized protein (TIGR00730 family)